MRRQTRVMAVMIVRSLKPETHSLLEEHLVLAQELEQILVEYHKLEELRSPALYFPPPGRLVEGLRVRVHSFSIAVR